MGKYGKVVKNYHWGMGYNINQSELNYCEQNGERVSEWRRVSEWGKSE